MEINLEQTILRGIDTSGMSYQKRVNLARRIEGYVDSKLDYQHRLLAVKFSNIVDQKLEKLMFSIAFDKWESAVQGARWRLDSFGNWIANPSVTVPNFILERKTEQCSTCMCSFINRFLLPAACDIEAESRYMAVKWIPKNATVLEVGARYGSVSCAISRVLEQSGKLVSVDADDSVWEYLERNRANFKCNFHIAKGLLGKRDGRIKKNHYGTVAFTEDMHNDAGDTIPGDAGLIVPHFTVADLENKHSLKFNVANFDCEGCLPHVLKDFPELVKQLKLLIIEVHDFLEDETVANLTTNGWKILQIYRRQYVLENARAGSDVGF